MNIYIYIRMYIYIYVYSHYLFHPFEQLKQYASRSLSVQLIQKR